MWFKLTGLSLVIIFFPLPALAERAEDISLEDWRQRVSGFSREEAYKLIFCIKDALGMFNRRQSYCFINGESIVFWPDRNLPADYGGIRPIYSEPQYTSAEQAMIQAYYLRLEKYRQFQGIAEEAAGNAPVCRGMYDSIVNCPEELPSWMGR